MSTNKYVYAKNDLSNINWNKKAQEEQILPTYYTSPFFEQMTTPYYKYRISSDDIDRGYIQCSGDIGVDQSLSKLTLLNNNALKPGKIVVAEISLIETEEQNTVTQLMGKMLKQKLNFGYNSSYASSPNLYQLRNVISSPNYLLCYVLDNSNIKHYYGLALEPIGSYEPVVTNGKIISYLITAQAIVDNSSAFYLFELEDSEIELEDPTPFFEEGVCYVADTRLSFLLQLCIDTSIFEKITKRDYLIVSEGFVGLEKNYAITLGHAEEIGEKSINIGFATTTGEQGVAIGNNAITHDEGDIVIGSSTANGLNSVVIGNFSTAAADDSIVLGIGAEVSDWGTASITIGPYSDTFAFNSITIGNSALSTDEESITIGSEASSIGSKSIAIGCEAVAGSGGTVLGYGAQSDGISGVSVGQYTRADGPCSVAIGTGATVSDYSSEFSIQLGSGTNSTPNTFQVGDYPLLNLSTGKLLAEDKIRVMVDKYDTTNWHYLASLKQCINSNHNYIRMSAYFKGDGSGWESPFKEFIIPLNKTNQYITVFDVQGRPGSSTGGGAQFFIDSLYNLFVKGYSDSSSYSSLDSLAFFEFTPVNMISGQELPTTVPTLTADINTTHLLWSGTGSTSTSYRYYFLGKINTLGTVKVVITNLDDNTVETNLINFTAENAGSYIQLSQGYLINSFQKKQFKFEIYGELSDNTYPAFALFDQYPFLISRYTSSSDWSGSTKADMTYIAGLD